MWDTSMCAIRGRGHIADGTPCQDHVYSLNTGGVSVAALADGAGSARLSHFGAEASARCASAEIAEHFDDIYAEDDGAKVTLRFIGCIRQKLKETAAAHKCSIYDLASTLLLAAVKEDRFMLLHIGDGVIGYMRDGRIRVASMPSNGEFANTTIFTTSREAAASMRIIRGRTDGISGFIMMSDGSEAGLFNRRSGEFAHVLQNIMLMNCAANNNTMSDKLCGSFEESVRMLTLDDCSIAVISPKRGYSDLSTHEKHSLLGLKRRTSRRVMKQYDNIIRCIETGSALSRIAESARLKPRFVRKRLARLIARNMAESSGRLYKGIMAADSAAQSDHQ